jgi:hypothetical protein
MTVQPGHTQGMVEKIERMEFDLETKDKVNFQNQITLTIMMPFWSTFADDVNTDLLFGWCSNLRTYVQ